MSVTVRRASPNDIPAMAELWVALVKSENENAVPDVKGWCEFQRKAMGIDTYYAFVAEHFGKVVGFNNGLISLDLITGDKYVEGGHFFVLPEYRKGSAGARLHRISFETGKQHGCKFLRRRIHAGNKRMVDRLESRGHKVREYIVDEPIGGTR